MDLLYFLFTRRPQTHLSALAYLTYLISYLYLLSLVFLHGYVIATKSPFIHGDLYVTV